jgi:predicted secreted protein
MKKFWITVLFPVAALGVATAHAESPQGCVSVPGGMVTPVKAVKHTHRVVRKTTTRHTVHRKVTRSSSSAASSSGAKP